MAISAVPFALQNVPINADVVREAVSSLIPNTGGIVQSGDFPVAQTGTPSMAVTVGVGRAWIPGTNVAYLAGQTYTKQGQYFVMNDASVTLSIATADNTNPRIDVVYIAIRDATYTGANNDAQLAVMTGTPAATPAVPAIPNNAIALAQVAVAANAASILNANITTVAGMIAKHAEWNITGASQTQNVVHNVGTLNAIAASTTDPTFYTVVSGSGIQPAQAGVYAVTFTQAWSGPVGTSRAFLQLNSATLGGGTQYARNTWGNSEDTASTSAIVWIPAGGAIYLSIFQGTAGALTNSGMVTITKVG